jgi:hypothetical protein
LLGPAAKPAVPALVAALDDLNPDMRLTSVTALARIDPHHSAVVPAITQVLTDIPDSLGALMPALVDLGPRAKPAVPQLLRLYRKLSISESMELLDLLEKIDPAAAARLWPREEAGPAAFSARQLESLWGDLGSGNTPRGNRAYSKLLLAPEPPVAFLKDRLAPVPKAEAKQIGRWLADLGSDRFEVRQKATEALERVELLAEPAIQEALKANPPLEAVGEN